MFSRRAATIGLFIISSALVNGCAGSRSVPPALPGLAGSQSSGVKARAAVAAQAATDVVAINAGGAATGSFAADEDFTTYGTWESTTTKTIATPGIASPLPQAVYQSQRTGQSFTYTIPGLTAGATYGVTLSFAEIYWSAAGKRVFNVTINGTKVLSSFDVFATAGAADTAVAESFTTTASTSGTIAIVFAATTDNAIVNGIEITTGGTTTPAPTATPTATAVATATPTPGPITSGLYINTGGSATGSFVADEDFTVNGTWESTTTSAIDVSGVTNPAPQAVFQSQRTGHSFSYTIPGFTAGQTYGVRLDFAEIYWSGPGKRIFNVSINGTQVLTGLDVYATTGAKYKGLAESFSATANSTGAIVIALAATTDNAIVNGIEITSSGSGPPPPTPTPSPTSSGSIAFNDYTTYGFDNQRDVYNPNSTAITVANVPNIHLAWQSGLSGDFNTQTQPVLATEIPGHAGVLFVGGGSGKEYAYDALTGSLMWTQSTGQEEYSCENNTSTNFGIGGTAAYDPSSKSLYVVGNKNTSVDGVATNSLFHLDGATGAILGQVNFAPQAPGWTSLDFGHTAVTLGSNGLAYVGTGATCDIASWRGRIAAVSVPSMTLMYSFFPVWNGTTEPWGGGGVWGWGGPSIDYSGNVLSGFGNTVNGATIHGAIVAPFTASPEEYSGYGEAIAELSSNLSSVVGSNHPLPTDIYTGDSVDLDLNGTPLVFQPNGAGCDPMTAIQGKSGALYLYDETNISAGPIKQYQLAPSSYADGFLGDPSYSPATGLLYVAVPSSNHSLYSPGLMAINPGCGSPSVVWHSAFGPDSYASGSSTSPGVPRSAPAVSAGGVVFVGTMCTSTGTTCSATTSTSDILRGTTTKRPAICCAPPGTAGGALWAIDASTGNVLNNGDPIIITGSPIRMAPTIDGKWLFLLDNGGNLYGLTIDPSYPAISLKYRTPSPFQNTIRSR